MWKLYINEGNRNLLYILSGIKKGGEGTLISNNSTVEISPNVTRKSMTGSFGCPQPISEAGFPEPMMSNQEIVKKLAEIGNVTKVQ